MWYVKQERKNLDSEVEKEENKLHLLCERGTSKAWPKEKLLDTAPQKGNIINDIAESIEYWMFPVHSVTVKSVRFQMVIRALVIL
jgi:hypothetical protein